MARARGFRDVAAVRAGGVGRDGRTTFVTVGFTRGPDAMQRAMAEFRRLLPSARAGPATAYLSGSPAIYQQFTIVTEQDVERSDALALPLVLVALLAIVATLVAALLPLVLGIAAVMVSLGLIFGIAHLTPTSVFILSIASIIGLGISLDYSLLLTRRFREELAKGQATGDAVARTVATAGEAILFSGLAVMIGFLGLLLIRVPVMSSFAIGGSVVVVVAVLAALTVLPALLSILGTRVNALRVPLIGRRRAVAFPAAGQAAGSPHAQRQGLWHRWATGVMRHPIITSAAVIVVVAVLAYPTLALKVGVPDASATPMRDTARPSCKPSSLTWCCTRSLSSRRPATAPAC